MNALDEYRDILRTIDTLEESLFLLDAKATKCTTHLSDEVRCPALVHDRIAEIVVQKCEVSNRINNLVLQKYAKWDELLPLMQGLNENERAIVTMRYLLDKPWEKIVEVLGGNRFTWYRILCSGIRKITTCCSNA